MGAEAGRIDINDLIGGARPVMPLEKPESVIELDPEDETLPSVSDPYHAHGRPSARPRITLHCLLADGRRKGFAWCNYDGIDLDPPSRPGGGPELVLRFAGREWIDIVIEGRNLYLLYDLLSEQKIGWIRECQEGRQGRDPDAIELRRITIRKVEPQR